MPVLEAIGTAVHGPPVLQSDVRRKAEEVLAALAPELLDKMDVFEATGIRKRHLVRELDWFLEPHGWAERAEIYRDVGLDIMERASRAALERAGVDARDVDGIVFVSTTGLATPSLDARLVNALGMRSDVVRVPMWGLGCVGGVAGLNVAADLAHGQPEKRFLLVSMELCSLAFNLTDMSVRAFVANTLFADGCAAALVRGDRLAGATRGLANMLPGAWHQWPDSESVMGWDVGDEGLRVVFSRRIPEIVASGFRPVVESYVKWSGASPDRYLFHPGGTKVLEAYEGALGIPPAANAESRDVLREYGNMSSPTVLFVIEEALRRRALDAGQHALVGALGPGFTSSLLTLQGRA